MQQKSTWQRIGLLTLIAVLAMALLATGCTRQQGEERSPGQGEDLGNGDQQPETTIVTLYFADDQAEYLVPEEREVVAERLPEKVVEELIAGSATGLGKTIPDGTELLSLEIADGVATVNFSQEFQKNHWGGSAGELMTVFSVVNSLGRLDGIESVQFLVEGEVVESIFGHGYTAEPIEPQPDLVK